MLILVCYDVSTTDDGAKRLRQIAQICLDRGVRVQYSIFECRLAVKDWVRLRDRLLSTYEPATDSLRFYFIDEGSEQKTEHHGVRRPVDVNGPLII